MPADLRDSFEGSSSTDTDSDVAHLLAKEQVEVRTREIHRERDGYRRPLGLVYYLGSLGRTRRRAHLPSSPDYEGGSKSRRNSRSAGSRIRRRRCCFWIFTIVTISIILNLITIFFTQNDDFVRTWSSIAPQGVLQPDHDDELAVLTRGVQPIACHSHNDYNRRVPLFEALHYGVASVEADVWAFDDELYVGHTSAQLIPERTFRSIYINSLVRLLELMNPAAKALPNGVFYEAPSRSLVLLVDFKTDGPKTLPLVEAQLEPLRERGYLTFFDGKAVNSRPITVVATGNAPFDLLVANATYRDIFFDAPLNRIWEDASAQTRLSSPSSQSMSQSHARRGQGDGGTENISSASVFTRENSYYASVEFRWSIGTPKLYLSHTQRQRMREQVEAAHAQGLIVRYWGFPGWPARFRNYLWREMKAVDVDVLNVDDLQAAAGKEWREDRKVWWSFW